MKKYKPGVLFGEELEALYKDAKENQFALPAVNTICSNTINATLETAAKVNSPVIIQFSNGGAQFIAGKGNAGVMGLTVVAQLWIVVAIRHEQSQPLAPAALASASCLQQASAPAGAGPPPGRAVPAAPQLR